MPSELVGASKSIVLHLLIAASTRTDPRYASGGFFDRKLEALLEGPLAGGEPVVVWGAGEIGKAWGRALRSRGVTLLAFVEVNPRQLGQRIHGARARLREEARARGIAADRLLVVA